MTLAPRHSQTTTHGAPPQASPPQSVREQATIPFPQSSEVKPAQVPAAGNAVILKLPQPLSPAQAAAKRAVDIVGSALLLVLLLGPMALVALLVKCGSRGPVFYSQVRVGKDGSTFRVFKFRSMVDHAEQSTGPVWARGDDARQTRLGRLLRRWCIDELPQLANVLLGQMSLVGPRPERPMFVDRFSQELPAYPHRHLVKPGLTGWAQVHGYYGPTSITRRLDHDLEYISRYSLMLDLWILLATPRRIFSGQGAAEPVDAAQQAALLGPSTEQMPREKRAA